MSDDHAPEMYDRRKSVTFTLGAIDTDLSKSTVVLQHEECDPLLGGRANARGSASNLHSPTVVSYGGVLGSQGLRTSKSYHSVLSGTVKQQGLSENADTIFEKERVWYDNYTAIDWIRDAVLDARRISALRSRPGIRARLTYSFDALEGWVLAFLTGVFTALFAYLIMISEAFLFSLKDGYCTTSHFSPRSSCEEGDFYYWFLGTDSHFFIYMLIAIAFALTSSALTMTTLTVFPNGKKLYMAAGSGIPEVKTILSGFIVHGFLGARTLVIKAVGLTLSVATGMNLGKEGPFVHIATCTANIISRFFPKFKHNESKRREAFSSACAAGVAVAFGAPIGGVLFALEEVSYYFPPKVMWRSFFCAAVAAVTLKFLNPHGTGKLVLLETSFEREWHIKELPIYVVIGVFGGIYGGVFCNFNLAWARSFRRTKFIAQHPVFEVFILCVITTITSYWNRYTKMGGTELVHELLGECHDQVPSLLCPQNLKEHKAVMGALGFALFLKIVLTIITFGCKIPAGIFVPTMCVGALFGRMVGLALHRVFTLAPYSWLLEGTCDEGVEWCVVPGIYAMVGAAATLAGVTRMTVSLAVIMFELTGSLNYVMPFMISIMVAKWIADAIQPKGIYDLIIELNDHPYLDAKEAHAFNDAQLVDLLPSYAAFLNTSLDVTSSPTIKASVLRSKIEWTRDEGFEDGGFSIVSRGQLVGYISLADLSLGLDLMPPSMKEADILIDPRAGVLSSAANSLYNMSVGGEGESEEAVPSCTDFRVIVDRAPIALSRNAPMELARELFAKLGLRYLCILDGAELLGVVHKKSFVKYLRDSAAD